MLFIIGVVVALAGTAHALRHAMLLEKFSAGMTCILHTAITVMNKTNNMRGQRRKRAEEAAPRVRGNSRVGVWCARKRGD